MPRILRIINRFNLGGPTYNAAYLSSYMPGEYETLLAGGVKDSSEASSEYILEQLGVKPVIIPEMKRSVRLHNDYTSYLKIKNLIREFRPDIVHTHASKAGTLGRLAASSMNVPVIVHTFHGHVFHSYFNRFKTSFYKNIERRLARRSDKIIAISENQRKELGEVYKICPPSKIEIIPLGFDLSRFRENMEGKRKAFRNEFDIKEDEIAIGIIGRLVPVKNHSFFLNALKKILNSTDKKVCAFIVGDGSEMNALQLQAKNLNIPFALPGEKRSGKPLTFTSWIKDVDRVNAGMDIIALTSHNEGTPVSLIEAQASGKPVVSTNVGGIENVVKINETGMLSDSYDLEKFSENLLELIENEKLQVEMSEKGWPFVKEKFHYMRLIKDMDHLYQKLLNEKS